MKITLKLAFIFAIVLTCFTVSERLSAKSLEKKVKTLVVETSAQCGMCKKRLESGLLAVKGVKTAELNMENMQMTIIYKTKHTNEDALKAKINAIGYDANELPANQEAHDALPKCCQKGGHGK